MRYVLDMENPDMEPGHYYWPKVHGFGGEQDIPPAMLRRATAQISPASLHDSKESVLRHFEQLYGKTVESRRALMDQLALLT